MRFIDKEIWDSYYKFCFERNPWDKVISWYYWTYKSEPRPSISDFVQSTEANIIKGFELYTCFSNIVVDKVFLYEDLDEAMNQIRKQINLNETPILPRAKFGYRKGKRSYQDIFSEMDKERIKRVYASEIVHFNFEW